MSNRRSALQAGVPVVTFPPAPRPGVLRRWQDMYRARREVAVLSARLREDAGLPATIVTPDTLPGIGALRFHR